MASDEWPNRMPRMAWGLPDNLPVSAVPLEPGDPKTGLTRRQYIERLTARVQWMIERSESPRQAMAALADAMEAAGAWSGPRTFPSAWEAATSLLLENPGSPEVLNMTLELPDEQPFRCGGCRGPRRRC